LNEGGRADAAIASLGTDFFHSLTFDPVDTNTVYFGYESGVMVSPDLGQTWRRGPLDGMRVMHLALPRPDGPYYAAGSKLVRSTDGGITWEDLPLNLTGASIHGLAVRPDEPSQVFAYVEQRGLYRSLDAGETWQPVNSRMPPTVFALAASGGDPPTLYAGKFDGGVLVSTDGGLTWQLVANRGLSGQVRTLVLHPDGRSLYAGTDSGLYVSTDGAHSFRSAARLTNIAALAFRPGDHHTVVVVDGRGHVFRSRDGGRTW
jgi:photosystem II stability/assembly factor-like uncharacterized protein